MGRHAKSVEDHIRDGTFKATRHGQIDPSKFQLVTDPTDPAPPASLPEYAVPVWHRLYPVVTSHGILTDAERETFTVYCEAAGLFDLACAELKRSGIMVRKQIAAKGSKPGPRSSLDDSPATVTVTVRSDWYDIKREAAQDMLRAASLMGLTPVDRTRVVKAKEAVKNHVPQTRPRTGLDGRGPLKAAQ